MTNEVFRLKARMKDARLAVRSNKELAHDNEQYRVLKSFLTDMASNLADQRPEEFDDALGFVVRTMGFIVQEHAGHAYEPHGYENPFTSQRIAPPRSSEAAKPTAPSKPLWRFPVVSLPDNAGSTGFGAEFRKYSALKMFGYTVGKTGGWPAKKRQGFLSDFMELELPPIVRATFGDEYGDPMSATRLRKVANLIAANATNFYRNNPVRFDDAISDWEDDLTYLRRVYYEGAGLKFQPWPTTRI